MGSGRYQKDLNCSDYSHVVLSAGRKKPVHKLKARFRHIVFVAIIGLRTTGQSCELLSGDKNLAGRNNSLPNTINLNLCKLALVKPLITTAYERLFVI